MLDLTLGMCPSTEGCRLMKVFLNLRREGVVVGSGVAEVGGGVMETVGGQSVLTITKYY